MPAKASLVFTIEPTDATFGCTIDSVCTRCQSTRRLRSPVRITNASLAIRHRLYGSVIKDNGFIAIGCDVLHSVVWVHKCNISDSFHRSRLRGSPGQTDLQRGSPYDRLRNAFQSA